MGARGRDERRETLQELVALHQHVGRAIAPAGLQAIGEAPIGHRFQALEGEWRPRHVAAQTFEPASVARRNGHVGVKAHPAVLGHACRGLGIGVAFLQLDAIAESPPALTGVGSGGDARSQGSRCQQG